METNRIRVVLVRPEEPGNVGATARVLKNFGLDHLVLVQPRLGRPREAYKWAHGAEDVVEAAEVVEDLDAALAPCTRAWALSRRRGKRRGGSVPVREAARALRAVAAGGEAAWVLGPESSGLSSAEVTRCSDRAHIPTSPRQPSLNLAQAVAVCSYETFLADASPSPGSSPRQATLAEREAMYAHLEAAFLEVGFLLPHTAETRMALLRGLLERGGPTPPEVRLLRGLARRIQWAGREAVSRKRG